MNGQPTALVTGAHGFVGRHVARQLARRGFQVTGIGHGSWAAKEPALWGLREWHESDVTLEALRRYAQAPSVILHCAGSGSVTFSVENPLADFARTVGSTANVLEYIRLYAPACRIVYPSSASVYGTVETLPIGEDARPAPISPYGTHKLMAEQLIASHAMQFGTATAIVRLFSVYGTSLRKQLLWDACCKMSSGDMEFMGTGNEVRDWLHVEDAANLMLSGIENACAQCPIVNGGSGEGLTVREVLTHLARCLLDAAVTPVFSGANRTGDPSRYIADVRAAKAWGWQPEQSWQQGIEEYAHWWRTVIQ